MQSLFITATGTNIGKTHTTLKLIPLLAARGISVGVFKPVETGVTHNAPDASRLLEACQKVNSHFSSFSPTEITAYTFPLPAAPFCADTTHTLSLEKIFEKYQQLSSLCDLLLIEGAGGLMVPLTQEHTMINLAQMFQSNVLLVTPSRLGCINDTLLSIEALKQREIPFEWCVNLYEDKTTFAHVTQPYYDACFPEWWSVEEGLARFVARV